MERRNFLSFMGLGAATVILGGAVSGCSKTGAVPDGTPLPIGGLKLDLNSSAYAGLKNRSGAVTVNNNIIVAHVNSGEYVALSNICTHQGCTVGFDGVSSFQCPCHQSMFAKDGSVIMGPASYPLTKYDVSLIGSILTITN